MSKFFKMLILLTMLLLTLSGCSQEIPQETTVPPTAPAGVEEIGNSSYYCTTEQSEQSSQLSGAQTVTATAFSHEIYDPDYEYIATLTAVAAGTISDDDCQITSINATLSEEQAEGLSISEHLSGDTGTVILYRNGISVCHFQYRLYDDGTAEFLQIELEEEPVAQTTAPIVYTGEEAEVHQLVQDFLDLKHTDFQSEEHLDFSPYFAPELRNSLEEQLSWKVFRFEKLVRYSIREKLLWEKFRASVNEISIDGDTAAVTAFDVYEYELADANGTESGRGTTLLISCQKIGGEWYITNIETDNELIEGHVDSVPAADLPALAGVE